MQAGRAQLLRGLNTGIRSISHKEARVMYFDPLGSKGHSPLTMVGDTVNALLYHYMRFPV